MTRLTLPNLATSSSAEAHPKHQQNNEDEGCDDHNFDQQTAVHDSHPLLLSHEQECLSVHETSLG